MKMAEHLKLAAILLAYVVISPSRCDWVLLVFVKQTLLPQRGTYSVLKERNRLLHLVQSNHGHADVYYNSNVFCVILLKCNSFYTMNGNI